MSHSDGTSPVQSLRYSPMDPSASNADLLRILVSVLLPPFGVFLQEGLGKPFWINVLLTLMGYVPGLVHAVWTIARR